MSITYKFPFALKPTTPSHVYLGPNLAAEMTRYFGSSPSNQVQMRQKQKYVNFMIKDYLNSREYMINQDYGGFFKKQGWGVYDEKDRKVAHLKVEYSMLRLRLVVQWGNTQIRIKFKLFPNEAEIEQKIDGEYINVGSTIVSHVFGRQIEVDRDAADKTELEFGQFMAIIHTGWCCSGKL
ncbi:hypothetical protein HUG20_07560 [Salicibibacter cibi]|uniref:Uncharacterized protein n=1 Tax=Salicibibacter cibi TaxID=2743001 RepID=A0A7T6ZA79_9BACI|nr:hypothetical protein [Salicibibacter cibi]QQK79755.1 hypothetical protein HUG20_07560 [Salicibibacter cibi]